jgi:hypothetical protein
MSYVTSHVDLSKNGAVTPMLVKHAEGVPTRFRTIQARPKDLP